MADYTFLLSARLSQDQQLALEILQSACRRQTLNLYLCGGSMRDLLTGQTVRLLSCTTEGDPLALQSSLAAAGAERISWRQEAAALSFSLRACRLRVQAAHGSHGAAGASIHEDLRRRGLTLNSVGLSLNSGSFGLPLDPANGAADIEQRLIRMNHPYVFLDDPVTALRAVRLRARLGFSVEERTLARMEAAREGDYLEHATPAARGQEWEAIAYEPDPAAVLAALEKEQWLAAGFGAGVRTSKMDMANLTRLTAAVESWEQLGMSIDVGLLAMPMLLAHLPAGDQARLAQWLPSRHLATGWKKVISEAEALSKRLLALDGGGAGWLRAAKEIIEKSSCEAVVYASLAAPLRAAKKLRDFHALALEQRQKLPLGVLRGLGMAPRSLQAETLLRPWYRRLLAGEALSEAELSEGVRQAALALRPVVATAPPEPEPRRPARAPKSVAAKTGGPASARNTKSAARSKAKARGKRK
ncbi:MAG: hypothetical protein ACRD04_10835 [Terriglobales bacterium]